MGHPVCGIGRVIAEFESTQARHLPHVRGNRPLVTAIGSVAARVLGSDSLQDSLTRCGITARRSVSTDPDHLKERGDWSLALVLSPYKFTTADACDTLTPCARAAATVDTVLRGPDGTLHGINTNAFGIAHAVGLLFPDGAPARVLILGTGATSRSAVVGLRTHHHNDLDIRIRGRDWDRTCALARELGVPPADEPDGGADLVLNCTTVGETTDTPLEIPIERALRPGVRFFDLNNRHSQLQVLALQRGCITISGVLMQLTVNALRAHLLHRPTD